MLNLWKCKSSRVVITSAGYVALRGIGLNWGYIVPTNDLNQTLSLVCRSPRKYKVQSYNCRKAPYILWQNKNWVRKPKLTSLKLKKKLCNIIHFLNELLAILQYIKNWHFFLFYHKKHMNFKNYNPATETLSWKYLEQILVYKSWLQKTCLYQNL